MTDQDKKPTLEDVGERLQVLRDAAAAKETKARKIEGSTKVAGVGMRIGMELIAGVLVGGGLGWLIDRELETKPIFMLALIALGFAASVLSVLRILKGLDTAVGLGRAMREKEGREKEAKNEQPSAAQKAWDAEDD